MNWNWARIVLYITLGLILTLATIPDRLAHGHEVIAIFDGILATAIFYCAWLRWEAIQRRKARAKWDSTAVAVRDLAHHVHDEFSPFGSKTGLPRFVKHEDTNASSLSDSLQPESTEGTR